GVDGGEAGGGAGAVLGRARVHRPHAARAPAGPDVSPAGGRGGEGVDRAAEDPRPGGTRGLDDRGAGGFEGAASRGRAGAATGEGGDLAVPGAGPALMFAAWSFHSRC